MSTQLYFVETFNGIQNKTTSKITSGSEIVSQFINAYKAGTVITKADAPSNGILIFYQNLITESTSKFKNEIININNSIFQIVGQMLQIFSIKARSLFTQQPQRF